jgi:hypothetical protein
MNKLLIDQHASHDHATNMLNARKSHMQKNNLSGTGNTAEGRSFSRASFSAAPPHLANHSASQSNPRNARLVTAALE